MNGLEAAPLIRHAAPGATVVIVSAFSAAEMRSKAMRAGAHCYLQKSGSVKSLVGAVRGCLAGEAC